MTKPVTLDLEQGHTLLLKGPARIRAKRGDAQCFGAPIQSDDWTMIEESRQEPIYAADNTLLEIRRGSGNSWSVAGESTVPVAWNEAAQVLQRQRGVCVIIGEVDSGKSSLCTFLANKCLEDMAKVGVVDADVGQADVVLVNTDGWLAELNAIRHKQLLLEAIQPDLVIGLNRSDDIIDPLLDKVKFASLKLPSSSFARVRSKEERKRAREAGYRRFLQGSHKLVISQETRVRMFDRLEQTVFPENRPFRGFVSGLLNQSEELLSIGRINQVENGKVIVETKTNGMPTVLVGQLRRCLLESCHDGGRFYAEEHVIVVSVVVSFELDYFVSACEGACDADCLHCRFCSGVCEADHLGAGDR